MPQKSLKKIKNRHPKGNLVANIKQREDRLAVLELSLEGSDVDGSDGGVGAGDGDGRVGSLNRQPDELLLIRASAQLFERLAVGRLAVNFGEANASNHTLAI
ncbi:unnamed protein product [Ceratitis capitata]|uniref:(Mediterranean fruit fly) hypothetical protein n=1 Tax=Ceratitis capitata TaxID=7213 RepID=A0A811V2E0_CERCA|nr:unnamed protein product [Ceratitis capitata]